MDIQVSKLYKSRDNHKIRIYAIDGTEESIHGAYYTPGGWKLTSWLKDGRWSTTRYYDWDIVAEWEEPKTRNIAYISINGYIILYPEDKDVSMLDFKRAPWLDQPAN